MLWDAPEASGPACGVCGDEHDVHSGPQGNRCAECLEAEERREDAAASAELLAGERAA